MSMRMLRPLRLAGIVATLVLFALVPTKSGQASPVTPRGGAGISDTCTALHPFRNGRQDAAPNLQHCLDAAPPGATIGLPAGTYLLLSPIAIRKALTLTTAGPPQTTACRLVDPRCATLLPTMSETTLPSAPMPIDVQADGVTIDRLVFAGTRSRAPETARALCLSKNARALAGGLRLNGQRFRITRSVFRDFACYSALELGAGSGVIADNIFAHNGTHNVNMMWADGLTIHDAKALRVTGNLFLDNTDVQLILGGCADCTVSDNRFRHSAAEAGGSFADLMIQAWPGGATSGRYDGSTFSNNDVDCGAAHRCGFGIMIGGLPWYQAPTSGGTVKDNRVRNAMLGINIDGLSGPMAIGANHVAPAPGRYPASCGVRSTTFGINIAPSSRRFVTNAELANITSADSYANCVLNYPRFSK